LYLFISCYTRNRMHSPIINDILELSPIQVLTYLTVVGRAAWSTARDHCKPTVGFHRDRKGETCMRKAIRREMDTRLELSLSWDLPLWGCSSCFSILCGRGGECSAC
jgi:hypothetical protein